MATYAKDDDVLDKVMKQFSAMEHRLNDLEAENLKLKEEMQSLRHDRIKTVSK